MLLKQTLLYLPAQVLSPLVQFASVLVWSHLLAPADLGVVTLLVAMQEVCYAVFLGWWMIYTLRFIGGYTDPEERAGYLRTETVAIAGSILVQTLVMVPVLRYEFGAMTPLATTLALVFMITRSINYYTADRSRAEARIALYSLVQVVGPVIGFFFGLLCIWRFGPTPTSVLAGFIIAQGIGIVIGLFMSDFLRTAGAVSRPVLLQAIRFGGPATVAQSLAIVAINAPRFIVSQTLGLAAVGVFSVGYSLGIRASSFAVALVSAGAYPLVVRRMQTDGKDAAFAQLSQNMVLIALAVAPVAFGLLAINRSLVGLLVAADYRQATYAVLPLATLGGLFRYLRAHTSDQVFLLSLRPGYSNLIAISDIIVAVVSAFAGIKLFGLPGAALGPMASGLATFTLSFLLSRVKFGFRAPFGAFARIGAAALAMCAIVYAFPVARNVPAMIGYIAAGGVLFIGFVLIAMPRERKELGVLAGRLRRRVPGAARA